jgi:SAM-dependent methyltransferase
MPEELKNQEEETGLILDAEYWNDRYKAGQTGWDMHQASPPLTNYIDSLSDKKMKILIPGCGNAHEAEYLLNKRFTNVTLIDISEVVTKRVAAKYRNQPIKIVCGDFFKHTGSYDLILEQTFFCTLSSTMREKYIEKCFELLESNGKVAGVLFNKPLGIPGPPFILGDEEYKKIFGSKFTITRYEECKNSIPPRLGSEVFFEAEK